MAKTIRGVNTRTEVEKTADAAVTITGSISNDDPAVLNHVGHGLVAGDVVRLYVNGMTPLNGWAGRVGFTDVDNVTLVGINGTNMGTFVDGTFEKITAWDTIPSATNIDVPNQSSQKHDVTTLDSDEIEEDPGLPQSSSGTIQAFFKPTDAAVVNMRAATNDNEERVFRVTFDGGSPVAVFNTSVSAGQGFTLPVNAPATTSYEFTLRKRINYYSS